MRYITQTGANDASAGVTIRDGHDNYFTPLRLIFALLVVLGHAFVITLRDLQGEPSVFYDYGFSYLAVNLFFIASGFLVTKSMIYRGKRSSFLAARLLRIYPALIIHLIFILFIIGPLATRLPVLDYLTHADVWSQPFLVLSFINTDLLLPGVFETNNEAFASAPLWTLRYEVLCYLGTLLAFSLGLMRKKWMILAQFVIPGVIWIVGQTYGLFDAAPDTAENLVRFAMAYGIGATIYAYQDHLSFNWAGLVLVLALCWLFKSTPALEITTNLGLAWLVMTVAYARWPAFKPLQAMDDLSYGVYIYHWAILQMLVLWFPQISVIDILAIGLPVTILIAWLSWTFVEKPVLARKDAFGAWIRFGRPNKPYDRKTILTD